MSIGIILSISSCEVWPSSSSCFMLVATGPLELQVRSPDGGGEWTEGLHPPRPYCHIHCEGSSFTFHIIWPNSSAVILDFSLFVSSHIVYSLYSNTKNSGLFSNSFSRWLKIYFRLPMSFSKLLLGIAKTFIRMTNSFIQHTKTPHCNRIYVLLWERVVGCSKHLYKKP